MHHTNGATIAVLAAIALTGIAVGQENRMSPHESTSVTLGGEQIAITYGRPSIRNRRIMGGLVPYGQVWRTGADEATTLTTPLKLNINGIELAAGKYTLWTLPSAETWKLIVNKETGQWGTNYDSAQDLARCNMEKSTVNAPVDKFTISWKKDGERSATLLLDWENTHLSVLVRAQ